jgi:ADP-heptose:LPS heptosyltransferase
MLPKIACRPKNESARKAVGVQGAEITFGGIDLADLCLVTKEDWKRDKDWVNKCLKSGLPILTQANSEISGGDGVIVRLTYDLDFAAGLRRAIVKAQSMPMMTKGGRFVWPRFPRSASRTLKVKVDGGMGDMYVAMPALRELKKRGYTLYIDPNQQDKCKDVLRLCPDMESELSSGVEYQEIVITYHTKYAPSGDGIIARQFQYGDSCGVVINDCSVTLRLDPNISGKYLAWKRGLGKPVVALGLFATTKMKSMEPERAKRIAELLSKSYHVAVIHWHQTCGDMPGVTDWGGKLSTTEMVHLMSIMDGAICIDSGIAHTACALKVPTLAMQGVCGVGNHIRYALYGGRVQEECLGLKCSPCWPEFTCQTPGKDHYADCLKFSPDEIADKFTRFMCEGRSGENVKLQRRAMIFGASGGIGDRLAMLPALQSIEGHTLKLDPGMDRSGQEIFSLSPLFSANFDPIFSEVRLRPCDPKTDSAEDRALPIQDWHAKCAGVKVKDYRVQIRLGAAPLRQYQSWVYSQGRPVIGVSLMSAFEVQSRTMPEKHRERLIAALSEKYHVALIHSAKSVGDSTHVTDWGGKLSVREMIHLIAALDGMVAVDSGPAHIACVTGTPLVALMGIVSPGKRYALYGGNAVREMYLEADCAPCWEKGSYGCQNPPKCLEFKPEDILPALQEVCGYMASPPADGYWADWSVVCRYDRPFTEIDAKAYMKELVEIHKARYDVLKGLGIQPKKVAEIGVRSGNGARDLLMAFPDAVYTGFDAENCQHGGGPQVLTTYARSLTGRISPQSRVVAPCDTQTLTTPLPDAPFDVLYVDGDHTIQGVVRDLDLAMKSISKNGVVTGGARRWRVRRL